MLPFGLPDEFYEEERRRKEKQYKKDRLFYDFLNLIAGFIVLMALLLLIALLCFFVLCGYK